MTSISTVSSVLSVLPTADNKQRVTTEGAQFHAQFQAQSRLRVQQPDTINAQVLAESTTNASHRPEMEALLQSLEWRKYAASAPSRPGRSVPGTRASGLEIADFSFPDRDALVNSDVIKVSWVNEEGRPLSLQPVDDPIACTPDDAEHAPCSECSCEGGLNAFAVAVALSAITLTWVPIEMARAPLRTPTFGFGAVENPARPQGMFSSSQILGSRGLNLRMSVTRARYRGPKSVSWVARGFCHHRPWR